MPVKPDKEKKITGKTNSVSEKASAKTMMMTMMLVMKSPMIGKNLKRKRNGILILKNLTFLNQQEKKLQERKVPMMMKILK